MFVLYMYAYTHTHIYAYIVVSSFFIVLMTGEMIFYGIWLFIHFLPLEIHPHHRSLDEGPFYVTSNGY